MLPLRLTELYRRGLCKRCYNRGRRSRARFGGGRERVLARDHYLCRVCRAPAPPARQPPLGPDHPLPRLPRRLHRLGAIDRWVPDLLGELWAEQHPGRPRQLQIPPTR